MGKIEEKCIFSINQMADFRSTLAKSEEQFRLLPFPKYEEGTKTTYMTMHSFGHAQYCIPNDIEDPDRSAAVLETLGYASYIYVTPVIFEETIPMMPCCHSLLSRTITGVESRSAISSIIS